MHGDVFRPPRYLELLAALVGTGVQLALLVLSVILITIAGDSTPFPPVPQLLPTPRPAHVIAQHAMRAHVHWWGERDQPVKLCAGTLFTERGTIVTVFIICYALTSFVAGYVRYTPCMCCPSVGMLSV